MPRTLGAPPSESIMARVRIAPHVIRWVRERQHYSFQQEETAPDNTGVIVTYRLLEILT
jgi:hypothetical protein